MVTAQSGGRGGEGAPTGAAPQWKGQGRQMVEVLSAPSPSACSVMLRHSDSSVGLISRSVPGTGHSWGKASRAWGEVWTGSEWVRCTTLRLPGAPPAPPLLNHRLWRPCAPRGVAPRGGRGAGPPPAGPSSPMRAGGSARGGNAKGRCPRRPPAPPTEPAMGSELEPKPQPLGGR